MFSDKTVTYVPGRAGRVGQAEACATDSFNCYKPVFGETPSHARLDPCRTGESLDLCVYSPVWSLQNLKEKE